MTAQASGIVLQPSHRACFFGRTGSGKTTLALSILAASRARWVVLDAKEGVEVRGVKVGQQYRKDAVRQIITLPHRYEHIAPAWWNDVIMRIWKDKDRVIYVDELTLINPSSRNLYPALGRAIRTGRSRNVAVWCGSQRPKDIPSAVFTEAEHFFIFQLTFKADRDKVVSFTGDKVAALMERLNAQPEFNANGHDFVYYNVRDNRALYVEQRG